MNINTINNKYYIRSGIHKDLSSQPSSILASSFSLSSLGRGLSLTPSVVKLPTINPILQSAGLQTIAVNPLNAAGTPFIQPFVPLLPPSLFGRVPSHPDLRNPLLSDLYWRGGRQEGADYIRGRGINGLLVGADSLDPNQMKKSLYRNELLNQMDDNKLRRLEKYNLGRLENEREDERIRKERFYLDGLADREIGERRRRISDNQERAARYLKENQHRRDEDRYKYKRFRRGSEPVEAYWLDGYNHDYGGYNEGRGPPPEWWEKKYHHPFGSSYRKDLQHYYPPFGPTKRDWWWYGDLEAPWRGKGHYYQGKFVPFDVANNIQERVGKQVEVIREEMVQQEIDLQKQLSDMKQKAAEADKERELTLVSIKNLKDTLNERQLSEEFRHKYIYEQMMNSIREKDQLMRMRTELLPEITTQPQIDSVQFRLPDKPSERYDIKNKIPQNLRFVNENSKDGIDKLMTKVKIFDADYLNQVNSKRLDDLRYIDTKHEVEKDRLVEYLDRESAASKIHLHQQDVRNELLNRDILMNEEQPSLVHYQTPLKVVDRYKDLPTLDQISAQSSMMKSPISQKLLMKSYSNKGNMNQL